MLGILGRLGDTGSPVDTVSPSARCRGASSGCRRAAGGRALVHCRMGLSRSAATVLAYAMKEFGWPLERALRHVRHCRPGVLPNPGFMRQLDFYQGILSARCVGTAGWGQLGGACCDQTPLCVCVGLLWLCPTWKGLGNFVGEEPLGAPPCRGGVAGC